MWMVARVASWLASCAALALLSPFQAAGKRG
jgi:hypothetical protein